MTARDEIERLKRDADFLTYATTRHGYYVDDKECSPRGNPTHFILRRDADDAKILAIRGQQCWLYVDLRQHGGALPAGGTLQGAGGRGTIIDFIQEERRLPRGRGTPGFGLALQELRDFVGTSPLMRPHQGVHRAPDRLRGPSPEVAARWEAASDTRLCPYLLTRAISPRTLTDSRFAGTWRMDSRGNALFPHRDGQGLLTNFEMKNHGFTSYPRGGIKTGIWRSNEMASDRRLCMAESAIDALSFHQVHGDRDTRYWSASGNPGGRQLKLMEAELAKVPAGTDILLAFDKDAAGAAFEAQVRAMLPRHLQAQVAHPPAGKDWNEYLQARELDR